MTLADALAHRIYLHGYKRRPLPRAFRRVMARSPFHRAWLAGWHGCFTDVDTNQGGTMNSGRDHIPTDDEWDGINAAYDLDFSMCIEAELVENVEGLAGSGIRWPVLDAIVDCVAGRCQLRIETAEAIAYLRFLIAQGARHSWDETGYLLQLDLLQNGATFGPGKTGDVVAESFTRWKSAQ